MKYIEAPNRLVRIPKSIFLAGGISGCPDWQKEMVELLKDTDLTIFNPRRENFDLSNALVTEEQIEWEFDHLRWFPKETLCPITLFELGAWSHTMKPLFVGMDPDYQRRKDVEVQLKLARADVLIVYNLTHLAELVKRWT